MHLRAIELQRLTDAMGQEFNNLNSLQQLVIVGVPPGAGEGATAHIMPFLWLLASAVNLSLLNANLEKVPWFPPLRQLKHLILHFNSDTGNVFAYIQNAKKLETLSLTSSAGKLAAPDLYLESLPCLRAVALHCIRPASMTLPDACCLHLCGLDAEDFSNVEWEDVLAKVHSFDLVLRPVCADVLPTSFTRLKNLTDVRLGFSQLGKPGAHLSLESLSQVQRLRLSCDNMYLKVPARVSWRVAFIYAKDKLGIYFADTMQFAADVHNSYFECACLVGPSLFHLNAAWTARQLQWRAFTHRETRTVVRCPPARSTGLNWTCCCGVCMPCLKRSGIAQMD